MMLDTPRVSARKGGQAFSVGFGGPSPSTVSSGGGGAPTNKRGNNTNNNNDNASGAKKKVSSSSGPFKFLRKDAGQRADSAHPTEGENRHHHGGPQQHSFQRDDSMLHDMRKGQHHDPFATSDVALPKRTPPTVQQNNNITVNSNSNDNNVRNNNNNNNNQQQQQSQQRQSSTGSSRQQQQQRRHYHEENQDEEEMNEDEEQYNEDDEQQEDEEEINRESETINRNNSNSNAASKLPSANLLLSTSSMVNSSTVTDPNATSLNPQPDLALVGNNNNNLHPHTRQNSNRPTTNGLHPFSRDTSVMDVEGASGHNLDELENNNNNNHNKKKASTPTTTTSNNNNNTNSNNKKPSIGNTNRPAPPPAPNAENVIDSGSHRISAFNNNNNKLSLEQQRRQRQQQQQQVDYDEPEYNEEEYDENYEENNEDPYTSSAYSNNNNIRRPQSAPATRNKSTSRPAPPPAASGNNGDWHLQYDYNPHHVHHHHHAHHSVYAAPSPYGGYYPPPGHHYPVVLPPPPHQHLQQPSGAASTPRPPHTVTSPQHQHQHQPITNSTSDDAATAAPDAALMQQLEQELEAARSERTALRRAQMELARERQRALDDRERAELQQQADRDEFDRAVAEERRKLRAERKQADDMQRDTLRSASSDRDTLRRLQADLEAARDGAARAQGEARERERTLRTEVDRLRRDLAESASRNQELTEAVRKLQADAAASRVGTTTTLGSAALTRARQQQRQQQNQLGRASPASLLGGGDNNDNNNDADYEDEENNNNNNNNNNIINNNQNNERQFVQYNRNYPPASSQERGNSNNNTNNINNETNNVGGAIRGSSLQNNNNNNNKNNNNYSIPHAVSNNINNNIHQSNNNYLQEEEDDEDNNNDDQHHHHQQQNRAIPTMEEFLDDNEPVPSDDIPGDSITARNMGHDGKTEKLFRSGKREVLYSNGTRKIVLPSNHTLLYFSNGDIKRSYPSGKTTYWYAVAKTLHTQMPTGVQVFEFKASQQCEKHHPDGTKEVLYPDGIYKVMKPDGMHETVFPDGTVQKSKSENVQVVVRVRPFNDREKREEGAEVVTMDFANQSVTVRDSGADGRTFSFDAVYNNSFKQKDIYLQSVHPLVEAVLNGYNSTIFAYGQSGTGKSYSMSGDIKSPENYGIIPNAVDHIFSHVKAESSDSVEFTIQISFVELYMGNCRDLLNERGESLELRENVANHQFYVKDLTTFVVTDVLQAMRLMDEGVARREVKSTKLNAVSSRSHAVFTVYIRRKDKQADTNTEAKLLLVDLAGSERQSKTEAEGTALKEGAAINQSLTALGSVIDCLVKQKPHIPYRSSHLTMLLKDGLGGNSRTVIVGTISPSSTNVLETMSTLRFVDRAKQIKNKPKIQMDPKDAKIYELTEELRALKIRFGLINETTGEEVDDETASASGGGAGGGGDKDDDNERKQKYSKSFEAQLEELKNRTEELEVQLMAAKDESDRAAQEVATMESKAKKEREGFEQLLEAAKEAQREAIESRELDQAVSGGSIGEQLVELKKICTNFFATIDPEGKVVPISKNKDEYPPSDSIANAFHVLEANLVLNGNTGSMSDVFAGATNGIPSPMKSIGRSRSFAGKSLEDVKNNHDNNINSTNDNNNNNQTVVITSPTSPPTKNNNQNQNEEFHNGRRKSTVLAPSTPQGTSMSTVGVLDDEVVKEFVKKLQQEYSSASPLVPTPPSPDNASNSAKKEATKPLEIKRILDELLLKQRLAMHRAMFDVLKKDVASSGTDQQVQQLDEVEKSVLAAYDHANDEIERLTDTVVKQKQLAAKAKGIADKRAEEIAALKSQLGGLRDDAIAKHAQHAVEIELVQANIIAANNKKTEKLIAKHTKDLQKEKRHRDAMQLLIDKADRGRDDALEKYDILVAEHESMMESFEQMKVDQMRQISGRSGGRVGTASSDSNSDMPINGNFAATQQQARIDRLRDGVNRANTTSATTTSLSSPASSQLHGHGHGFGGGPTAGVPTGRSPLPPMGLGSNTARSNPTGLPPLTGGASHYGTAR